MYLATGNTKKNLKYLDDLQASGITNMFGGARYLVQDMGLDKAEADKVLQMWMRSKDQKEDFQEDEVDNDSNEAAVAKMIAKALGDENRWTEREVDIRKLYGFMCSS